MDSKQPFFSIIIPTFRRPKQLSQCLSGIALLDYPKTGYEVIVIDDGSGNPPEEIIESLDNVIDLILLTQPHAGPAAARNLGVSKAKGEFLVFTDDDCAPDRDCLNSLAARFIRTPVCVIGGKTINLLTDNPYAVASQLLIDYLYEYYHVNHHQTGFFTSNNLALPTDCFKKIGGFNEDFSHAGGEDREICYRLMKKGYKMVHAPEVKIYHAHTLALKSFTRQHFNYGRGAYYYYHARAWQITQDFRAAHLLLFYYNMLSYFIGRTGGFSKTLSALLMITSQTANAGGFFWELLNRNIKKLILPLSHRGYKMN